MMKYIRKNNWLENSVKWGTAKNPSVVNTGMNKIFSPMSKFTRKSNSRGGSRKSNISCS